ncbi:hypothetical protein MCOR32_011517 [Pyricularia oryzae]|nr:hypothetical protein MCOR32_011517 [Pyricularia oryzae]
MQLSTIVKAFVFITFGVSTTVAGPILPTVDDEPAYDCKHKGNFDPKLANKAKVSCSNHMHTYGYSNADLYIAPSQPPLRRPSCHEECHKLNSCQACRAYRAQRNAESAAMTREFRDNQDKEPTKRPRWKFWHKRPADPVDPDEYVKVSHGNGGLIDDMNMK